MISHFVYIIFFQLAHAWLAALFCCSGICAWKHNPGSDRVSGSTWRYLWRSWYVNRRYYVFARLDI